MSRPKLCILSLSTIHRDGRVLRQIEWAAHKYDVTVIGWGHLDKARPHVQMHAVEPWHFPPLQRAGQVALVAGGRFDARLWERWYWRKPDHQRALASLLDHPVDLIHVNEVIALPIAIRAAEELQAHVLFDAHEYSPDHRANNRWWRLLAQPLYTYLIRHYAPQADAMTTVGREIADRYHHTFDLDVEVVMNAPAYISHTFHPADPHHIRMIHQGAAIREREMQCMIDVVSLADARYSLDFMLVDSDPAYFRQLRAYAERVAPERVIFREPVPPQKITQVVNEYDIGLFLIPPVNYSYAHALPNKFFEFIMAGLAVAIGPSPEMARICHNHGLGIVAESFAPADLARRLNVLTAAQIDVMKKRSLEAARVFNADVEMAKLMGLYDQLLSLPER